MKPLIIVLFCILIVACAASPSAPDTRPGYLFWFNEKDSDGRQFLERLDSGDPPSIIFLDLILPYLSGLHLIDKIKGRDGWKEVPIIMISSKRQQNDITAALDKGADDYVLKPFNPTELMSRVRRLLKD